MIIIIILLLLFFVENVKSLFLQFSFDFLVEIKVSSKPHMMLHHQILSK